MTIKIEAVRGGTAEVKMVEGGRPMGGIDENEQVRRMAEEGSGKTG